MRVSLASARGSYRRYLGISGIRWERIDILKDSWGYKLRASRIFSLPSWVRELDEFLGASSAEDVPSSVELR